MSTRPTVNLGDEARDRITEFTGIVVCVSNWISGCERVTIQSQTLDDGKPIETQCFDVEQVEVTQPGAIKPLAETGGPCPAPVRAREPQR